MLGGCCHHHVEAWSKRLHHLVYALIAGTRHNEYPWAEPWEDAFNRSGQRSGSVGVVRAVQNHRERVVRYYLEPARIGGLGQAPAKIVGGHDYRRRTNAGQHAQSRGGRSAVSGLMLAHKACSDSNRTEPWQIHVDSSALHVD